MSLVQTIKSRGHWTVVIRPARFVRDRVTNIGDLDRIIEQAHVRFAGREFPYRPESPSRQLDFIESEIDFFDIKAYWRFYQSGQFLDLAAMREDWREGDQREGQRWLYIGNAIFRFFEIFSLAKNLLGTPAGDDPMFVGITLNGLAGRALDVGPNRMPFVNPRRTTIDVFPFEREYSGSVLAADPRDLAFDAARELFRRFSWEPPTEVMLGTLAEVDPRLGRR